jgi:molecular chaperone GrpE
MPNETRNRQEDRQEDERLEDERLEDKNRLEDKSREEEVPEASSSPAESAEPEQAAPEQVEAGLDAIQSEIDILRGELMTLQTKLKEAKQESADFKDRFLRARADLENYRRRAAQDVDRAREAGMDSAVLAVLPAYDDLGRALEAAETDPGKIIPGVEAVREGLKRNLAALGIKEVGKRGDRFDPDFHEALSSFPAEDRALAGTVAEVYQVGFTKEGRLVRPARVVVYQE